MMGTQLSLFDRPTVYVAPHNGTPTSKAAAESLSAESTYTIRETIYRFIASSGDGATREEIEEALGIGGNTVRPRVRELLAAFRLREYGERKTRSGRNAAVLTANRKEMK
jgi:hypothetical protein